MLCADMFLDLMAVIALVKTSGPSALIYDCFKQIILILNEYNVMTIVFIWVYLQEVGVILDYMTDSSVPLQPYSHP